MKLGEILKLKQALESPIVQQNIPIRKVSYAILRTIEKLAIVTKPYELTPETQEDANYYNDIFKARSEKNEDKLKELETKNPKLWETLNTNETLLNEHINDEIEVLLFKFDGSLLPENSTFPAVLSLLKPLINNWENMETVGPKLTIV